jgi:nicotinamidase-related amidase
VGKLGEITVPAEPAPLTLDLDRTALLIIDMQRDFLEPGGFGEALGYVVGRLQAAVKPIRALLALAFKRGLFVIHTREGHRPDLSDAPPAKIERGAPGRRIGDAGPMGRILVRGDSGTTSSPSSPRRPASPWWTSRARARSTPRTLTPS